MERNGYREAVPEGPISPLESRYLDAMQQATPIIKRTISRVSVDLRSEVMGMCRLAQVEVSKKRLDRLSGLVALETITLNPNNVIDLFLFARKEGEGQPLSEWLSRFAPDSYKYLVKHLRHAKDDDSEDIRKERKEIEIMENITPMESCRRVFIALGFTGSKLDSLMEFGGWKAKDLW
jgi:hypothetical protein